MTSNRYLKDTVFVNTTNNRLSILEAKTANLGTASADYKGYIYLNELRQAGETDDNLALQRAKVIQLANGFPIYLSPGKGSGTTADDGVDGFNGQAIVARFRAATGDYLIDAWSQASDTSSGTTSANATTLPNSNDSGNMWSGMTLLGQRGFSRIRRANKNKPFIFTCNPVNTTATTVNGEDVQSHIFKNMFLSGLTFLSNVQNDGYSEYQAHVQLNAVDAVVVDNCEFLGHRGDGLQIGNGHISNGTQNRHNRYVVVRNTHINGANQNNRHAVNVIDCDSFLMDNVTTTQCGKGGSTSSANNTLNVFNPNTGIVVASSLFAVIQNPLVSASIVRNIFVRNSTATDGGANGISLVLNYNTATIANPTQHISVEDCTFKRLRTGFYSTFSSYTTGQNYTGLEYYIRFINNAVTNCTYPFDIGSVNGMDLIDNIFSDCSSNGLIGVDLPGNRLNISRNTFRRIGVNNYGAFIVAGMTGRIAYNKFEDCVGADFSFKGLNTVKDLTIDQNEVINTSSTSPTMLATMQVFDTFVGGTYRKFDLRNESVHVSYHPSNNLPSYLGITSTPSAALVCNGSRVTGFPKATSTWRDGSIVINQYNAPRGEIEVLRKTGTFTGSSPADRWTPSFLAGLLPIASTVLGNSYVGPIANTSTGAPPGIVVDDNNRLTAALNGENFWKGISQANYSPTYGNPWATVRCIAPSLLSNGIMMGFTHYTDQPTNWIANNYSFGVVKFGILFNNGLMQFVVGGALSSVIDTVGVKAILGVDRIFHGVQVNLIYNVNTGEGRVIIVHPDTKAEVVVGSLTTSATGQAIYPMARMVNANEFIRLYL